MARKVYVDVKVRLIINMDGGTLVSDVMEEAEYGFISQTDGAEIEEMEIRDWDITDSK